MANENIKTTSGEEQSAEQPRRGVIAGKTFRVKMVNYSPIDGQAIFEGDIVLGSVAQLDAAYEAIRDAGIEGSLEGIAITGSQHRWPNGKIPYVINPKFARSPPRYAGYRALGTEDTD